MPPFTEGSRLSGLSLNRLNRRQRHSPNLRQAFWSLILPGWVGRTSWIEWRVWAEVPSAIQTSSLMLSSTGVDTSYTLFHNTGCLGQILGEQPRQVQCGHHSPAINTTTTTSSGCSWDSDIWWRYHNEHADPCPVHSKSSKGYTNYLRHGATSKWQALLRGCVDGMVGSSNVLLSTEFNHLNGEWMATSRTTSISNSLDIDAQSIDP